MIISLAGRLAATALALLAGLAAAEPGPALRFAVVSDCHMTGANSGTFAELACEAMRADPAGPPAFLVANGDLDPFMRVAAAVEQRLAAPLRAAGLPFAFYPVVGNHDLFDTSTDHDFRTAAATGSQTRAIIAYNRKHVAAASWGPDIPSALPGYEDGGSHWTSYSFDAGAVHLAVLDLYAGNDRPGRGNGNAHRALLAWLDQDLARAAGRPALVFGHEPLLPYTALDGTAIDAGEGSLIDHGGAALLDLLRRHQVAAYFSGHSHHAGVAVLDGTTHINSGRSGVAADCTWVAVQIEGMHVGYRLQHHRPGTQPAWRTAAQGVIAGGP